MRTTEIFVEQVLIGFIVLGVFVSLAFPCSLSAWPLLDLIPALQSECSRAAAGSGTATSLDDSPALVKLGFGALLTGIAYFLGLIYDRIADTICAAWEQHNRLQVALEDFKCDANDNKLLPESGDPFPEDRIRYVVQGNSSRVEWADYLRSRIRLSRALATLIPAIGVTCAVLASAPAEAGSAAVTLLLIYVLVSVVAASRTVRKMLRIDELYPPKTRKTDRRKLQKYWERHRCTDEGRNTYIGVTLKPRALLFEPTVIGIVVLVLLTYGYAAAGLLSHREAAVIAASTGGLTLLIGNVWWRITRTYFAYLKTAYETEDTFAAMRRHWRMAVAKEARQSVPGPARHSERHG